MQTNGDTCNDYCESQGTTCINGANNVGNCDWVPHGPQSCDQHLNGQICVCARGCNGEGIYPHFFMQTK